MSTLYAVGCSHTRYCWPTYADILSQEYDNFENWGQSGFGNFAIMHRVVEIADKMQSDDRLIVQWTYPTRFDFHRKGDGWYQGGNLQHNFDQVQDTINKFAYDPDSYQWHMETFIKLTKQYLDTNVVDYNMIGVDFNIEDIEEFPDKQALPKLSIMKEERSWKHISWIPSTAKRCGFRRGGCNSKECRISRQMSGGSGYSS